MDGVLVVNELIDVVKRRRDKCLLLKVDFEKAYDSVNWRRWMKACVNSNSVSILVINGNTADDFEVKRGLRQGDPLAPFLFLIAAEGLAGLVGKAVELGHFSGI